MNLFLKDVDEKDIVRVYTNGSVKKTVKIKFEEQSKNSLGALELNLEKAFEEACGTSLDDAAWKGNVNYISDNGKIFEKLITD